MGQPRPLFCLFSVFAYKQYNVTTNICEKCPSSIRCRDSNPRPSERESLPITTRPGLPPTVQKHFRQCIKDNIYLTIGQIGFFISHYLAVASPPSSKLGKTLVGTRMFRLFCTLVGLQLAVFHFVAVSNGFYCQLSICFFTFWSFLS